jgi:hypothetical protein
MIKLPCSSKHFTDKACCPLTIRRDGYREQVDTVEQEYRSVLPGLLGIYPGLRELRMRETHRKVTHVAHGWYMRCHRGVEAVLQLEQSGFQEEAGPIRRSIVEHSVALKWLAEQGNVVATFLQRGASHEAQKRKDALTSADWTSVDLTLFDAVINDGKGLDRQHDTLLSFKHRCDRFGSPHDLATYLNETARCHPSWESAVPYLDLGSETPVARSTPAWSIDQAGFCVLHLLGALLAMNDMLDGTPIQSELDAAQRQVLSIVVRQRREQGLPIPSDLERHVRAT